MLLITLSLGALLGGLVMFDPMNMRSGGDEDATDPQDQTDAEDTSQVEGQGDLLDGDFQLISDDAVEVLPPEGQDGSAAPEQNVLVLSEQAQSPALPAPDQEAGAGRPDGYDAVPGDHVSDYLGGALSSNLGITLDATTGGSGDDEIEGGDDRDLLMGNEGDDSLSGGAGRDYLDGGAGDDRMSGGFGADQMHGMQGDDRMFGGAGDDLMTGGDGDDRMDGNAGNDRMFAGRGNDLLRGGAGDDLLDGTQIDDGVADDGADTLMGGDGDDTIALGRGDIAIGGAGSDTYIFAGPGVGAYAADSTAALPTVVDFDVDADVLELVLDNDAGGEVTTRAEDGGVTILIGGEAVARLDGLTTLDPSLVRLAAA